MQLEYVHGVRCSAPPSSGASLTLALELFASSCSCCYLRLRLRLLLPLFAAAICCCYLLLLFAPSLSLPEPPQNAQDTRNISDESACSRPSHHLQSATARAFLAATTHTPHPQGTAQVVWSCLQRPENCLERSCCFTKSFLYRGGVVGSGIRRGRPRIHWAKQCATQAWHRLRDLPNPPGRRHPQFPFAFVQLHRLAFHRHFCRRLVGLPTCRKYFKQTCCIAFSQ